MLVARIKAAVAAEEVRKIRQRVSDKKTELAERGMPAGGGMRAFGWSCAPRTSVPRCWRRGCDHGAQCKERLAARAAPCAITGCRHDRGMSTVPAEADALVRGAAMLLTGEPYRTVGEFLAGEGHRPVGGGEWNDSVVRRTLTNPRIAGLRVHRGEIVGEATWPPILDRQTWERVCETATDRYSFTAPHRHHMLGGTARCGEAGCGNVLHGQVTSRRGK
jgi:hypothetical protein